MKKINLREGFRSFSDHWSPRVAGDLNGQHVKLVKFEGAFDWHKHDDEDEMFLVHRGSFTMELRDQTIELSEGEFLVVPKGVEHRPVATNEVEVILFEPASTRNTGDQISGLTVEQPKMLECSSPLTDHLASLEAVISDVDGVLTDGGLIRFADGNGGRCFNAKDGVGHKELFRVGVKIAWISSTKERGSLEVRAKDLGVEHINTDPTTKDVRLLKVCEELGVDPNKCIFIGDDIIDLPVLGHVGLFACPADAVKKVRDASDIILTKDGGKGAFRELADMIVEAKESE